MAGILDRFKVNLPEEEEVDVSHRIRAGIIGVGWITEAHVTSLLRCPDVEIVAAAELTEGKAERFFKKFNLDQVKCYRSHKEMLEK